MITGLFTRELKTTVDHPQPLRCTSLSLLQSKRILDKHSLRRFLKQLHSELSMFDILEAAFSKVSHFYDFFLSVLSLLSHQSQPNQSNIQISFGNILDLPSLATIFATHLEQFIIRNVNSKYRIKRTHSFFESLKFKQ